MTKGRLRIQAKQGPENARSFRSNVCTLYSYKRLFSTLEPVIHEQKYMGGNKPIMLRSRNLTATLILAGFTSTLAAESSTKNFIH